MSDMTAFRELGISEKTIEALKKKGFEEPTPIQAAAIPLLLANEKDVIGQAQTGTGKTATFAIPILELIQPRKGGVQSLILTPTRELTIQVAEEINSLQGDRRIPVLPVYGGQNIEIQQHKLKRGADVVVGTPGRVLDLIRRGDLDLSEVVFAVLDEADEMLNMGFIEDVESILEQTPEEKKMLLFSATMPEEIRRIAEKFMHSCEHIRIEPRQMTSSLTEQIYFEVRREDKLEALCRILDMNSNIYALVFCRTRNDVDELCEKLAMRNHNASALHGDIPQAQRLRIIEGFKKRKFNVLAATDVAARGIDVNDLTHVINYSIPQQAETYIHRIGRTGRAGKQGTAITFVTPAEFRTLTRIKREAKTEIRREEIPAPDALVERKVEKMCEKLAAIIDHGKHECYISLAETLLQNSDHTSLLAAFLRLTYKGTLCPDSYAKIGLPRRKSRDKYAKKRPNTPYPEFDDEPEKISAPEQIPAGTLTEEISADTAEKTAPAAEDLTESREAAAVPAKPKKNKSKVDKRGHARVFIALGKEDGYGAGKIASLIEEATGIPKHFLGQIDCMDHFSFVNASFRDAEAIVQRFRELGDGGRSLAQMAREDNGSAGAKTPDKNKAASGKKSRVSGRRDESRNAGRHGGRDKERNGKKRSKRK